MEDDVQWTTTSPDGSIVTTRKSILLLHLPLTLFHFPLTLFHHYLTLPNSQFYAVIGVVLTCGRDANNRMMSGDQQADDNIPLEIGDRSLYTDNYILQAKRLRGRK